MIAKDESLFVVMDALNQVRRHRSTEKALLHSHDVTDRVAASFSNTERLEYMSLLHFFNNVIFFGRNFSSHANHLRFHDDSRMSTTSWLGRSFPYISITCWYASLSTGTLEITVGIKNKILQAEYDNMEHLISSERNC